MAEESNQTAANAVVGDDEGQEETDNFEEVDGASTFMLDPASMAILNDREPSPRDRHGSPSVATTQLASEIGSVVGPSRNAFLKSLTFFDPTRLYSISRGNVVAAATAPAHQEEENEPSSLTTNTLLSDNYENGPTIATLPFETNELTHWDITLRDPPSGTLNRQPNRRGQIVRKLERKLFRRQKDKQPRLEIESFGGLVELSAFESGDFLLAINGTSIYAQEYSTQKAMDYMRECLSKEGVLSLAVENCDSDCNDTLINISIIKPRPDMTYEDLGLVVWFWGYLCVREIKVTSIFRHTVLQETDQIVAVNNISCKGMKPEGFARAVSQLPAEIFLTIVRRKQRLSGAFT